jgi:ribonuclease PH
LGACEKLFEIQRAALKPPYPGVLPEGPPPKKAFGA